MARGLIATGLMFVEKKAKREPGQPPTGIQQFPEAVGLVLGVNSFGMGKRFGQLPLIAKLLVK
jgi:hypothetical protein